MIPVSLRLLERVGASLGLLGSTPLPLPLAYRVAVLQREAQGHLDTLQVARRQVLSAHHPQGKPRFAPGATPEQDAALADELDELLDELVELRATPLRRADFPAVLDGKPLTLAPSAIAGLGPLFQEDDTP